MESKIIPNPCSPAALMGFVAGAAFPTPTTHGAKTPISTLYQTTITTVSTIAVPPFSTVPVRASNVISLK